MGELEELEAKIEARIDVLNPYHSHPEKCGCSDCYARAVEQRGVKWVLSELRKIRGAKVRSKVQL